MFPIYFPFPCHPIPLLLLTQYPHLCFKFTPSSSFHFTYFHRYVFSSIQKFSRQLRKLSKKYIVNLFDLNYVSEISCIDLLSTFKTVFEINLNIITNIRITYINCTHNLLFLHFRLFTIIFSRGSFSASLGYTKLNLEIINHE